jgi:hypothetical protein
MGFTSFKSLWGEQSGRGAESNMVMWSVLSMLSMGGALGCGVEQEQPSLEPLTVLEQAQREDNGLSLNGLSLNGLSLNGLSLNGLSLNGLNTLEFKTWFQQNPAGHGMLMSYLVRCAVPSGDNRIYVDQTGARYEWAGDLGLAPDWALGHEATIQEQQVISACLAAHVNNYGVHVPISVLGLNAKGQSISYTSAELEDFTQTEACFFGNVFTTLNPGLFAGNDRAELDPTQSTPRPCGLRAAGQGTHPMCEQIPHIGQCGQYCTLDAESKFYTSCTYKGITYKPLTTRLRPEYVNTCGDHVCSLGESKGSGFTADSCKADCGE